VRVLVAAILLSVPATTAWAEGQGLIAAAGLSGSIALDYFSSNHDLDDRRDFPGANLVLKQRRALPAGLRWVAEARVLAQQIGHEHEDATHGSVRSLRYVDEVVTELREGYLEIAREHWELRVGKQIIAWGRADEVNPTDVVTPKDFLLLLPEGQPAYRYGVTSLKLDYFLPGEIRASGVWVPFFSPSLIPLEPAPDGVRLDERLPAIRFEDGSAGIKLDRSGGEIDVSLAYFYGFNLFPEVRVESVTSAPNGSLASADVTLSHARQHMIGADFAAATGGFGYRGEIAYLLTDNPHGRDVEGVTPSLFYVLGIERSFFENLSVVVQYVGRYVFDRVDPRRALAAPDPLLGSARFLAARETQLINQELDTVQNGWSGRIGKRFWNDTLECELLGLHYFERNDFLLRPRIAYELADGWQATIGGEVFGGPARSFLGRLQDNSGGFAELKYSF
jgi:hypothetical protein